jgi:hypothetical protein
MLHFSLAWRREEKEKGKIGKIVKKGGKDKL